MPTSERVVRGRVVHYNTDRKFGFIEPDKRRPDGKQLFFHLQGLTAVSEKFVGELDLDYEVYAEFQHEPHKSDKVVFHVEEVNSYNKKGPQAINWNFEEVWEKAAAKIAARPDPHDCPMRICLEATKGNGYKEVPIWQGYSFAFHKALKDGSLDEYLDLENIFLEMETATGWKRTWHPREHSDEYRDRHGMPDRPYRPARTTASA